MNYPTSSYFDVKAASLAGVPNYDWFVGPGYDGRISTSVFAAGFTHGLADHSQDDAMADPLRHKNLPYNAQNLYEGESEDGTPLGYHLWDNYSAALDLAPLIPNIRLPGWNRTGDCLRAFAKQPIGHAQGNAVVQELDIVNVDPGSATGLLFAPPALPPYGRSPYHVVPKPQ
jgi:hypothetical protein